MEQNTKSALRVLELSSTSLSERKSHSLLLLDLETKKRAATLIDVPTLPHHVRDSLRNYGLPIRLFGENNANVRDRLRLIMARELIIKEGLSHNNPYTKLTYGQVMIGEKDSTSQEEKEILSTKYTHATKELVSTRHYISEYSLMRAHSRLNNEMRRRWAARERSRLNFNVNQLNSHVWNDEFYPFIRYERGIEEEKTYAIKELNNMDMFCQRLYDSIKAMNLQGSQYADSRPLSAICTSQWNLSTPSINLDTGNIIATGGWSGSIKIWDGDSADLNLLTSKSAAHKDRIMGIAMKPWGCENNRESTILATASIDLTAKIWCIKKSHVLDRQDREYFNETDNEQKHIRYNIQEESVLKGHAARLCKVAFHPTGRYLGTTSYDHTWRFWDIESDGKELLLQDGHWKEVCGICFHPDGSLVCTTDFGSIVRLWDLRTGKSACHFLGHAKRVLCTDFSHNGFQLATGGDDGTIKIWDLRQRKLYSTIAAHSRLITELKFANDNIIGGQHGEFLASSSFDNTAKIWGTRDWNLLSTLHGHEGKVMGVAVLDSENVGIFTCGFDRTLKVWK